MVFDVRSVFVVGVLALFFTLYYLEKHYEREEIFWMYSLLSAFLGLLSAFTVITDHPSRQYYIPLTAISITLAILYYQSEKESPGPEEG